MSINEINEQAKQSLKKYFKDSQDIQHDDDTKKQLTIEEMYQSVDDEIKEQEKKLEELHQMRHALQHNAKEAYEAVYGKTDEAAENSISRLADVHLYLSSREMLHIKIGDFASTTSLKYLFDILYAGVFSYDYKKNFKKMLNIKWNMSMN